MAGQNGNDDFEALARQYWSQWGDMLRAGATPASSGFPDAQFPGMNTATAGATLPGWNEAVAWWSKLAQGGGIGSGFNNGFGSGLGNQANATVDRFNTQAQAWYGQMQQLAAQFAGQDASASDIAGAWKRALGGDFGNPFADVLRDMQGPGQQGFEQWVAQVMPFIEKMQRDGQSWSSMPAFGLTREHQERWQHLMRAQSDYQQQSKAYQALMVEAVQDAFKRFEDKLIELSEPGKQLESARALFDLWIDAAEDAYADIALSPRFRQAYGAMVNAQMRLRAAVQDQIEQMGEMLGVPTRREVDAAHRKIVELERQVRRLSDLAGHGATSVKTPRKAAARKAASSSKQPTSKQPASKSPARKTTTKKPAARKSPVKKSPARKSPVRKTAAKKTTAKKLPARKPTVSKRGSRAAAAKPTAKVR